MSSSTFDALFEDSLGPNAQVGSLALYSYPMNGYAHHHADALAAGLVVGQAYRIFHVDVYAYSTDIWLEGYDWPFNSCMFTDGGK